MTDISILTSLILYTDIHGYRLGIYHTPHPIPTQLSFAKYFIAGSRMRELIHIKVDTYKKKETLRVCQQGTAQPQRRLNKE